MAGSGAMHLALGGFGPFDRFALYATGILAAATLAAAIDSGTRKLTLLALLPVVLSAAIYLPPAVRLFPEPPAEAAQ